MLPEGSPQWANVKEARRIFGLPISLLKRLSLEGSVRTLKLGETQQGDRRYYCPDIDRALLCLSAGRDPGVPRRRVHAAARRIEGPGSLAPPRVLAEIPDIGAYRGSGVGRGGCIYFLVRNGEVVYVGQTIHLSERAKAHSREASRPFDSIWYQPVSPVNLDGAERAYVQSLAPRYNKVLKGTNG